MVKEARLSLLFSSHSPFLFLSFLFPLASFVLSFHYITKKPKRKRKRREKNEVSEMWSEKWSELEQRTSGERWMRAFVRFTALHFTPFTTFLFALSYFASRTSFHSFVSEITQRKQEECEGKVNGRVLLFRLISMERTKWREARIKPNAKRKESRELFLLKYTTNNRNHSPNLGLISSPYQRSFIIG